MYHGIRLWDIILETKGLEKKEDGNIIIIKGKGKFKSHNQKKDLDLKSSVQIRSSGDGNF
jgi:hypothetical protein